MIQEGFSLHISKGKVQYETFFRSGNDSFFFEKDDVVVAVEGIILNKSKLLNQHSSKDFPAFFVKLFQQKNSNCIKDLEGEFRGFIYDRKAAQIIVFTNPVATQSVYFTQNKDGFFADSSLGRLNSTLKTKNISTEPNLGAIYQILVCINTLENQTVVQDVHKLLDGELISVDVNTENLQKQFYFSISTDTYFSGSKNKAIDTAHEIFSDAVFHEYDKDIELQRNHLALLSGGLDSRVAAFYAIKNGQKPDSFLCFSQTGYLDETIARKIASDYGIPFEFVALDGGSYLKCIDEVTAISEGSGHFTGGVHVKYATENLQQNDFGIFHSGQIGDGILGGFNTVPARNKPSHFKIVNRTEFLPKIETELNSVLSRYETEEVFLLRNVAYNRTVLGSKVFQQTAFQASPFMVKDFLTFSLSLPESWKFNHRFYLEWIAKHLPDATKYQWERTMMKPDAFWKTTFGDQVRKKFFIKWNEKILHKPFRSSMYPYQYYFSQTREIQQYYQDYFDENLYRLENYPELKKDIEFLFAKKDFHSKSLAVNVLAIFKLFFF